MNEHGHSEREISERIGSPPGRGILRDAVYGAVDGAVTTFAIVAGVAGAGLSPLVILALGFANVLADGFSMAAANYSGAKTEMENFRRVRDIEERHIRDFPDGERLEVREILSNMGLSGRILTEATASITGNRENWISLMMEGEYGLGGVAPNPLTAATATFLSFLAAGVVPLFPFVFGLDDAFELSAAMTLLTFFAIGALRSHWSLVPWWRSGIETLLIGGSAASIAFLVGRLFHA